MGCEKCVQLSENYRNTHERSKGSLENMLAIRLQRIGRAGYPVYRIAVQESQRHPSSGRVVAYVGSYNPHTKQVNVQVDLAQKYPDMVLSQHPRGEIAES